MATTDRPPLTARHDVILVRPATPDDQAYVASTWHHSMARTLAGYGRRMHARDIDRVLDHSTTRVLCAREEADKPDFVAAWLCFGKLPGYRLLHYVYVRSYYRRQGYARRLWIHAGLADETYEAADPIRPLVYTQAGPDHEALLAKFGGQLLPLNEVIP